MIQWRDRLDDDKPALHELVHQTCGQWLQDVGREHGFKVDAQGATAEAYTQHRGKDAKLRFSSVDFAGELKVLDPGKFVAAFTRGIGHAKAFGCGLLLVRRLD